MYFQDRQDVKDRIRRIKVKTLCLRIMADVVWARTKSLNGTQTARFMNWNPLEEEACGPEDLGDMNLAIW